MITSDQLAALIARLAAQLGQDDDAAFADAFGALVGQVGEPAASALWVAIVTCGSVSVNCFENWCQK